MRVWRLASRVRMALFWVLKSSSWWRRGKGRGMKIRLRGGGGGGEVVLPMLLQGGSGYHEKLHIALRKCVKNVISWEVECVDGA